MVAGTPPKLIVRFASVLAPSTTVPGADAGFTGPNPMPYTVIRSPGAAGRNGTPAMRLGFPTKVKPSENRPTKYCLPPILKLAGARTPGAMGASLALKAVLAHAAVPAVMITTGTAPVTESAGA